MAEPEAAAATAAQPSKGKEKDKENALLEKITDIFEEKEQSAAVAQSINEVCYRILDLESISLKLSLQNIININKVLLSLRHKAYILS
jgi:hypothetical protein